MTTVTYINQKGGVGKSTLTALSGEVLAEAGGPHLLMIDLDPLGTLSDTMLAKYGTQARHTVTDWLTGSAAFADAVTDLTAGLHLLSADNRLEDVLSDMASNPGRVFDLRRSIAADCAAYDLVFIDAPPSLSALAWAAIIAADVIVVPTLPDTTSVKGLHNVMRQIEDVRANLHMAPTLIGTVANMVDRRVLADRAALAALAEPGMPPMLGTLPRRRGRRAWTQLQQEFRPIAGRLVSAVKECA